MKNYYFFIPMYLLMIILIKSIFMMKHFIKFMSLIYFKILFIIKFIKKDFSYFFPYYLNSFNIQQKLKIHFFDIELINFKK